MKKIELKIQGMHCNSCTMLVKDALTEKKGVKDAQVDLKKNSAKVTYDESLVEKFDLIKVIEGEGYKVV